jgi:hypothetical protein
MNKLISISYSEYVSVAFRIHHPIGMGPVIIVLTVACLAVQHFATLYGTIFGKMLFTFKRVLLFSTSLSKTHLILKIAQRDMTINVRKVLMYSTGYSCPILIKAAFSRQVFEKY